MGAGIERYCVYFIRAEKGGPVKIGLTSNIRQRLASLQACCPFELGVMATIEGCAKSTEATLHRKFAGGRLHGEWFREDTPGLLELVADVLRDDLPEWLERVVDMERHPPPRLPAAIDDNGRECEHKRSVRFHGNPSTVDGRPVYRCETCDTRFYYPAEEEAA